MGGPPPCPLNPKFEPEGAKGQQRCPRQGSTDPPSCISPFAFRPLRPLYPLPHCPRPFVPSSLKPRKTATRNPGRRESWRQGIVFRQFSGADLLTF